MTFWFSAFLLALRALWRNRLRASLTVLGILIGVAAVVLVSALGTGARDSVTAQVASLGSNVIVVFPQAANASGARSAQATGGRLTLDDGKAIAREATSLRAWAPVSTAAVQAVVEGHNTATTAVGSTRAYVDIRAWPVENGAMWEESSETLKERVCVVGATVQRHLFGADDPVGHTLRLGRYPFRVVGVLGPKGQSSFGNDQDDIILMPHGTFRSRIVGGSTNVAGFFLLSATAPETSDRAVRQATDVLKQRHRIGPGKEPDFVVRSQAEFQAMQQGIFQALTLLLLSVAAISLVVGGIGVMNIMLVSVTQRTREIGLRMAIGAREADILLQFLLEAILLAWLGGMAGVLVSASLVFVLTHALSLPLKIQGSVVLVAAGTSTLIGVVFGYFPARKAARMDPVHALGRE